MQEVKRILVCGLKMCAPEFPWLAMLVSQTEWVLVCLPVSLLDWRTAPEREFPLCSLFLRPGVDCYRSLATVCCQILFDLVLWLMSVDGGCAPYWKNNRW